MRSFAISLFASLAAAHGSLNSVSIDGQSFEGYEPSNPPGSQPNPAKGIVWASNDWEIGFVLPDEYKSDAIICHHNAMPAPKAATVAAGGTVDVSWPNWPMEDAHPGPILTYLAPAGTTEPSQIDKNSLKFFKIAEAGYDPNVDPQGPDKGLATGTFKANGLVSSVKIPSNIKPGMYVMRHEIIALHAAEKPNGAQNYPQCLTLEITGSGTEQPQGIPATEFYSPEDPGILVKNFYYGFDPKAYKVPGPALMGGGTSGSGSSPSTPAPSTGTSSPATDDGEDAAPAAPAPDNSEGGAPVSPAPATGDNSSKSEGEADDGEDTTGADDGADAGDDDGEDEDGEDAPSTGGDSGGPWGGRGRHHHWWGKSKHSGCKKNQRRHARDFSATA